MKESRNATSASFRLTTFVLGLLSISLILYFFGEKWLREILIYLSQASWARERIMAVPLARRVSRRFVAGETLEEAMAVTRALNARGMGVTLDYLGESVTDEKLAIESCREVIQLLDRIESLGVEANVSVKLSQLGIGISEELALDNMRQILARAKASDNWVRIDMEESELVEKTLEIFRTLRDVHGFSNVGVVIQSYLYTAEQDVRQLVSEGAWVRLVKGAYLEPPDVAFPKKADTDANFLKLSELLISKPALEKGVQTAIATHDDLIIRRVIEIATERDISPEHYEIQMLYGIRRKFQEQLVDQGFRLRVYVPYGTEWYPYLVRRLAERPANLWFFVSNLLRE